MTHSKNYKKYKMYFKMKIYTVQMIRMLTDKNDLTVEEFEEITGEKYD